MRITATVAVPAVWRSGLPRGGGSAPAAADGSAQSVAKAIDAFTTFPTALDPRI